jgi:hypothetical protein
VIGIPINGCPPEIPAAGVSPPSAARAPAPSSRPP